MGSVSKFTFFKEVVKDTSLTESARLVAIAIANYSDAQGLNSRPGNNRLIEDLGICRTAVKSSIKSLISRGWIVRAKMGDGRGNASVYHLNLPVDKLVDMSVDSEIKGSSEWPLSKIKGSSGRPKRGRLDDPHQINDHINAREAKGSSGDPLSDLAAKRAALWRDVCARRGVSPDYQTTRNVLANWPDDEMRQPSYVAEKIFEIWEMGNVAGGGAVVHQFPKSN